MAKPGGTMTSIVPYKVFAAFSMPDEVSLRRDGGMGDFVCVQYGKAR